MRRYDNIMSKRAPRYDGNREVDEDDDSDDDDDDLDGEVTTTRHSKVNRAAAGSAAVVGNDDLYNTQNADLPKNVKVERLERRRESNRLSKRRCRGQRREMISSYQKDVLRLTEEQRALTAEKEQLQKELVDCVLERQKLQDNAAVVVSTNKKGTTSSAVLITDSGDGDDRKPSFIETLTTMPVALSDDHDAPARPQRTQETRNISFADASSSSSRLLSSLPPLSQQQTLSTTSTNIVAPRDDIRSEFPSLSTTSWNTDNNSSALETANSWIQTLLLQQQQQQQQQVQVQASRHVASAHAINRNESASRTNPQQATSFITNTSGNMNGYETYLRRSMSGNYHDPPHDVFQTPDTMIALTGSQTSVASVMSSLLEHHQHQHPFIATPGAMATSALGNILETGMATTTTTTTTTPFSTAATAPVSTIPSNLYLRSPNLMPDIIITPSLFHSSMAFSSAATATSATMATTTNVANHHYTLPFQSSAATSAATSATATAATDTTTTSTSTAMNSTTMLPTPLPPQSALQQVLQQQERHQREHELLMSLLLGGSSNNNNM